MSAIEANFEYQMLRDEIRAENTLVANRLTWYVTSQSFLVSAFAISRGSGFAWFPWFSTILLPLLGITASVLIFPSILGASRTITLWHTKQHDFFQRHIHFKAAFELQRPGWIERRGLLFPMMMPVLFGLFWLILFAASRVWHRG